MCSFISNPLQVVSDVLQGSILGPIIFVNNLPETVSLPKVLLFADDTKCFKSVNSSLDSHLLQQDLQQLTMWAQQWHLSFRYVSVKFSPRIFVCILMFTSLVS